MKLSGEEWRQETDRIVTRPTSVAGKLTDAYGVITAVAVSGNLSPGIHPLNTP